MKIQNLTLRQGNTWDIDATIYGSDKLVLDLTGYTLRAQLRLTCDDVQPTATFIVTSALPTTGVLNLLLSANSTATIAAGKYVYDVEIELNGVVSTPIAGVITVQAEVTK